ncbi:MAG TPA: F0F1 ATP synthase subunit A [Peptococcaceae bacterium]|jgi:F-type H+-transporting ATPase subunit a|nr:F0F1 ATP synthase subunit A [Clostridia bacterium]HOB81722.1 F0F1 ATP synthase subunit A [Peptococcaceae bacterium]HPZ71589.1 F0F1 ATP synthase subunit A [Peptococcaceae bacterium]HQD54632.1 F0F1 ATP synthase subunit A [Peptococcaceae bacterium]
MFATPVYAATEGGAEHGAALFKFHVLDHVLEVSSYTTTMWGLMLILAVVSFLATRNLKLIPTSRLQVFMEMVLEMIIGFLTSIMGDREKAKRYLPLLGTFFLLILLSNYSGLLPGAGHVNGLAAPTSTLSVTAGFAIVVFFATHYYGIKAKGLGYFKHFFQPIFILFPLNVLEEFTRPLSLSLRLFGNIYGEEMVIAGLFSLVPLFLPLPIQLLSLLFGFIQAFVFTLLAAVYINSATAGH